MRKIRIMSRILCMVFITTMVFIPILFIGYWWGVGRSMFISHHLGNYTYLPNSLALLKQFPLTQHQRIVALFASTIALTATMMKQFYLVRLFKNFGRQIIFSEAVVRSMRMIALVMCIWQLVRPFYQVLIQFILTQGLPVQYQALSLSISSQDILHLLTAMILLIISWVLYQGYEMRQEQSLTI